MDFAKRFSKVADISPIEIDKFCDYLPFISTITNLVALLIKAICSLIENHKGADPTTNHHYFSYLHNDKKAWRCAVLLIPIFGNLYILMHPEELVVVKKVEKKEIPPKEEMPVVKEVNIDSREMENICNSAKALYMMFSVFKMGDIEFSKEQVTTLFQRATQFDQELKLFKEAGGEVSGELAGYVQNIDKYSTQIRTVFVEETV